MAAPSTVRSPRAATPSAEECPTPAKVLRLLLDGLPAATVVDLVRGHVPDTQNLPGPPDGRGPARTMSADGEVKWDKTSPLLSSIPWSLRASHLRLLSN